eukprot:930531-Prorocentrum_minimum.AAC.1
MGMTTLTHSPVVRTMVMRRRLRRGMRSLAASDRRHRVVLPHHHHLEEELKKKKRSEASGGGGALVVRLDNRTKDTDDLVCHKFPVDDSFSVGGGMDLSRCSLETLSNKIQSYKDTKLQRYKGDTRPTLLRPSGAKFDSVSRTSCRRNCGGGREDRGLDGSNERAGSLPRLPRRRQPRLATPRTSAVDALEARGMGSADGPARE